VLYRQNKKKQFYIGTQALLIPQYYSFTPQSKIEFVIYNYVLKTSTPVNFNQDGKNLVTGLTIQNQGENVFAKKVSP
jgi:hypothetical protein